MSKPKQHLKKVLSEILGAEIELENNGNQEVVGVFQEKEIFVDAIKKWQNAWKQQNTLFNKYGIDLSGYDSLLYSTIEGILLIGFGIVKYGIITSFVYNSLDTTEDMLKITDNKGKEYFVSDASELYDFIVKIKDEDFIKKD